MERHMEIEMDDKTWDQGDSKDEIQLQKPLRDTYRTLLLRCPNSSPNEARI